MKLDRDLTLQIIRHIQWPRDNNLDGHETEDFRRPTPYWVYQKMRKENGNDISRRTVNGAYERIFNDLLFPRLFIDPSIFGFRRSSVVFRDDVSLSDSAIARIKKIPGVEAVFRGIALKSGDLFPTMIVDILHNGKEDFNRVRDEIIGTSGTLSAYFATSSQLLDESVKKRYRETILNSDMEVREPIKDLIRSLVINPMMPLNDIALETGMSRSRLYEEYRKLAISRAVSLEFGFRTSLFEGFTFLQFAFSTAGRQKDALVKRLQDLPGFKEKSIIFRWGFDNILLSICIVGDYSDMIGFYSTMREELGDDSLAVALWQSSTRLNLGGVLRMIDYDGNGK